MRIKYLLVAVAALFASPLYAETTAIVAGSVIADARASDTGPATIIVEDGKIVDVVRDPVKAAAEEAVADRVIDLSDKTVLPGMVDLHTHLSGDPSGDFWARAVNPPRMVHACRREERKDHGTGGLYDRA